MTASSSDPAERMNRMYRFTRYIYDASRRYYLLGRDELIDHIADRETGAVLEVGCGTARNLIALARRASPFAVRFGRRRRHAGHGH